MTRDKTPVCFVAMAFDQDDTDQVYDRVIEPILKRNRIKPVIINRQHDNRDINIQIIVELKACDFCIADLTYTRPSVYFEAGFAQSRVDVIYTVRADHLKRDQPEDRRVHFDLQMKPLIKWKSPSDPEFAKKLETRLKHTVLAKLKRRSNEEKRITAEKERFASLPLDKRLRLIRAKAVSAMKPFGFKEWTVLFPQHRWLADPRDYTNLTDLSNQKGVLLSTIMRRQEMLVVSINAKERMTLNQLKDAGQNLGKSYSPPFLGYLRRRGGEGFGRPVPAELKRTKECHFILTLTGTLESRVMSALPYLAKDKEPASFSFKTSYEVRGRRVERNVSFLFVSGVYSLPQFEKALGKVSHSIQRKLGGI
jgi:nucleoside 2-deoxyribosyltransferase